MNRSNFLRRLGAALRPGDYFVAAAFLALALSSFRLGNIFSQNGRTALVFVRNRLITALDLRQNHALQVNGAFGQVALAVAGGGIRVAASSCPNQYCVKQGAIHRPQQMLVCVPNHLLVTITGPEKTDLDAITH